MRRLCHEILNSYYRYATKKFALSTINLEMTQRERLKIIMSGLATTRRWQGFSAEVEYEELIKKIPTSSYADYKTDIESQKSNNESILCANVIRFEPTSGSTDARKWIPYSKSFLSELNRASVVWLGDLYDQFPLIKNGTHYWSLSWLPPDLRKETSNNDLELFPFYQRFILTQTMSVSDKIAKLESFQEAWWATLLSLAADKDLSLVSVWSPTFFLKITSDLVDHWQEVSKCLLAGSWGDRDGSIRQIVGSAPQRDLRKIMPAHPDFFKKLWPKLSLISAWDSSTSSVWADEIRQKFSHVKFQGKGLWATEGVLSFPFQGKNILALNSHFYEFRNLTNGKIVPSWELELGGEYQPILWTSSGLLRYALPDRVRVSGFVKSTPCIDFLSRIQSTDLVGEKIDVDWVRGLFDQNPSWKAVSLVACQKPQPHYVLVHMSDAVVEIESQLLTLHHYQLARSLSQLGVAASHSVKNIFNFLQKNQKSKTAGQNKIEVLFECEQLDLID